jgi:hypothetical protein
MKKQGQLNNKLADLRSDVAEQTKIYESSKILLYRNLVKSYLWWREAQSELGYLDSLFKEENIKYRTLLNRQNFNPVIRLIFKMQNSLHAVQISNWASALNAIDDEYINNPHIYKNRDAVDTLVDWIRDSGGLASICGKTAEQIEAYGYDKEIRATKRSSKKQNERERLTVIGLRRRAAAELETDTKFDVGPVGTGEDNFVVLLAKATGVGSELKLIGTTAQEHIIDAALNQTVALDLANLKPTFRALCEAIKLNTIPAALQLYGARKNFYQKTNLSIQKGEEKYTVTENSRVVVRSDGSFLVSKIHSLASLTTYITPKAKFALAEDVWLRGADRFWLETELINESAAALYTSTENIGLAQADRRKVKAVNQLNLKNTITKQERSIYFYSFDGVDDLTSSQPCIASGKIDYDWTLEGNAAFFSRLYHQHFAGWQHRIKHRVHTSNNKVVAFDVTNKGIVCEKKWSKEENSFTQSGSRYLTEITNDTRLSGAGRFMFAPTDIIQTLSVLADSPSDMHVQMRANSHLMNIEFENALGNYSIFIPSCAPNGKRDAHYFVKFVPND